MAAIPGFEIFRDSRRRTSAAEMVAEFRFELRQLSSSPASDELNTLLLLAGELECALADAPAANPACHAARLLTDHFAAVAVGDNQCDRGFDRHQVVKDALVLLDRINDAHLLTVSVPEGFAYYALHPLDYADLAEQLALESPSALVVGLRSIGTTLSAVVAAKLRQTGKAVSRFTVRPAGHPYERSCDFDSEQRQQVAAALARDAVFLICDEGPGRSGSSLLSVAEALQHSGVPPSRILILCAHEPDVDALCARDAARRWRQYRVVPAGMTRHLPADASEYVGGGEWRRQWLAPHQLLPAVWPQMERLRYRGSADGKAILSFEGHGRYGSAVRARQHALSRSGFGLPYLGQEMGFGRHRLEEGRVAERGDLSTQLLQHMARYCAWRALEFPVSNADSLQLEATTSANLQRQFGAAPSSFGLDVRRPCVCDGRMMPHEWLLTAAGWRKLDAATHGDDHFFPGPCDIAWDLAGIVVEWGLSAEARSLLLDAYHDACGDSVRGRLPAYELAYAAFRMAWSGMAAASAGCEEEDRLLGDYESYKAYLLDRYEDAFDQNATAAAAYLL